MKTQSHVCVTTHHHPIILYPYDPIIRVTSVTTYGPDAHLLDSKSYFIANLKKENPYV